jgi:membrane-associated phospholipid phosphatase
MNGCAQRGRQPSAWSHFGFAVLLALLVFLVFWIVYGGTDYLSTGRTLRRVHFDFELLIPFVPAMTLAYISMNGLFLLAPFLLRTPRELAALAASLVAAILIAGIGFLLWPAEPAFPQPKDSGIWADLFHTADRLNLRYNMAPSLHVALSVATVAILARGRGKPMAVSLCFWGVLICVSTVLVHQHHLIDIATGAALGIAVDRMVYRRMMPPARLETTAAAMRPAEREPGFVAGERLTAPIRLANPTRDRTPSA